MGASDSKVASAYTLSSPFDPLGTSPSSSVSPPPVSTSPFTIHRAVHKSSGSEAVVFAVRFGKGGAAGDGDKVKGVSREAIVNAVQRLKTIRHPGVIKFVDADILPAIVLVVTEPVVPLMHVLDSFAPEAICLGIFGVLKTVDFLHSQGLCHNNLGMEAMFVTDQDRRWVLGEMQFVSSIAEVNASFISGLQQAVASQILPPEDSHPTSPKKAPDPRTRDVYALGRFITALTEPLDDTQHLQWTLLHEVARKMMANDPLERPTIREVLGSPFFEDNALVEVVEFLKDIKGVGREEKIEMFNQLPVKVRTIPISTIVAHILPLVLSKEIFSEPGAETFFRSLFTPTRDPASGDGILPPEAYALHVLPFIEEMVGIREWHVRIIMLRLLDGYLNDLVEHNRYILESVLVSEVRKNMQQKSNALMLGLEDEDPTMHMASLCALASIIPRLCHTQLTTSTTAPSTNVSAISLLDGTIVTSDPGRPGSLASSTSSLDSRPSAVSDRPPIARARSHSSLAASAGSLRRKTSMTQLDPTPTSSITSLRRMTSHAILMGRSAGDLGGPVSISMGGGGSPIPLRKRPDVGGGAGPRVTVQVLVENVIIPHALNVCVNEDVEESEKLCVLDALILLWKRMCVVEANNKAVPDIRILTRSILKSFHLIMKVLPPLSRADFFSRVVGDLDAAVADSGTMQWLSRVVELGNPFLRDESREVRHTVSDSLIRIISLVTSNMDRAPTVSRKRDEGSVSSKLRKVYGGIPRTRGLFPKSGPRAALGLPPPAAPVPAGRVEMPSLRAVASADGGWDEWEEDEDEAAMANGVVTTPPLAPKPKTPRVEVRLKRDSRVVSSLKDTPPPASSPSPASSSGTTMSSPSPSGKPPLYRKVSDAGDLVPVSLDSPAVKPKEEVDYFKGMEPKVAPKVELSGGRVAAVKAPNLEASTGWDMDIGDTELPNLEEK
ncbi:Protein-associating with the carboxyl-terminal domain of ezrin [Borealophlyctis nickersoniae]|nr:Protein-associating with the carboxyl-terminal domain of ezrin [Borealophlyctis nickersoniae]